MSGRLRRGALGALLVLVLVAAACSSSSSEEGLGRDLRIGVLPDRDEESLRAQFEPLVAYLEEASGMSAELVIPTDYQDLLRLFDGGQIDLAWFGGLTFIQADTATGASPLTMRDVDLEFTSDIIVSARTVGDTVDDFAGGRFAFGPELSTSGHLMPRNYLAQQGIEPEDVFESIVHSGGHDETVRWVRDGMADIGAANTVVVERMFASGEVTDDDVRVLTRTTPYRNYVWATSTEVGDTTRTRLLNAFLALDRTDDEQRRLLERLGAGGFVPATPDDFTFLREAAVRLGLVDPDGTT